MQPVERKAPPSWVVVDGKFVITNNGTTTIFHKDQFPGIILEMAKALKGAASG